MKTHTTMHSRVIIYLLAVLFSFCLILPEAKAQIVITASPTTVAPSTFVMATWSGQVVSTAKDWIGLYTPGASDYNFLSWIYVSCTQTPTTGAGSGSCFYFLPNIAVGTYELRFFFNDGFSRLATSNTFTIANGNTLSIASTNPASGVPITVSVTDINGQNNGSTQFSRVYASGAQIALTAPSNAGANNLNTFSSWTGCDSTNGTTCNVTMSASKSVVANYTATVATLTVASSNPPNGVAATISPNDINGQGNGSTQVTRVYSIGTAVSISVPLSANGNPYGGWTGCASVNVTASASICSVSMTSDKTVTVNYTPAGPSITASPASVLPGGVVTATWAGITNFTARDWIGLYTVGAGDGSYLNWVYVSCTRTAGSGASSGSCPLSVPSTLGNYELRLFSNDGFGRLATSSSFAVANVITRTLTAVSVHPLSGVALTVGPNDNNGQGNGSTQFSRTYTNNTSVTLTAPATAAGYLFSSWSGCDTSSGTTCNVTLSSDRSVTVTYAGTDTTAPDTSISSGPTGTIPVKNASFSWTGTDDVTPAANLVYAYRLDPIESNFSVYSSATSVSYSNLSDGTYTFYVKAKDQAGNEDPTPASRPFTVLFAVTRTLTVASSPNSGVALTVSPNDNNAQGNGSTQFTRTYNNNTAVTITAPATSGGNNFSSWSGCDSVSSQTCNVTMGADKTVTATYVAPAGATITATPSGAAQGSVILASWNNIASPSAKDWIGLYTPSAGNASVITWVYVSCTQTSSTARGSGSCGFGIPGSLTSGNYELRLLSNDGYTSLAKSNAIAVAPITIVTANVAAGTNGVSYNQTLTASGGAGGYNWITATGSTISNTGLTLGSDGKISGTPTTVGTFQLNARVQDSLLAAATKSYNVVISANSSILSVITTSLPTVQVSKAYSASLSAVGGSGSYTWSLAPSSAPLLRGLTLTSDGTISGVPIELGTSVVTFQVNDTTSLSATAPFAITSMTSDSIVCCNGFTKPFFGYWSFDDGSAFDDSGERSNGSLPFGAQVVPGKVRNALKFDGSSQYVDLGPVLDPNTGDLSVSAWVKTTQPGGSAVLISKFDSTGGFEIFQNNTGTISARISNGSTVFVANSTGAVVNDDNWHFVVVVFDRHDRMRIYIDGIDRGSTTISSILGNDVASHTNLRFGLGSTSNQGAYWNGSIDEVRIFTRKLFSAQEVADLYNAVPRIVTDTLPDAVVGVPYKLPIRAAGGTQPYNWSTPTTLPGLSINNPDSNNSDASLAGTPTSPGPLNFTVSLDDGGVAAPVPQPFSLNIRPTSGARSQLFSDNFANGLDLNIWKIVDAKNTIQGPSVWTTSNGDLIQKTEIQTNSTTDQLDKDGVVPLDITKLGTFVYAAYPGSSQWQDYDFTVRMMFESIQGGGVIFRRIDDNNYYRFSVDYRRHFQLLVKFVNGAPTQLAKVSCQFPSACDWFPFEMGQSYDIRVLAVGTSIKVFLDNKKIFDVIDSSLSQGTIGLYTFGNQNTHFGNVLVTTP